MDVTKQMRNGVDGMAKRDEPLTEEQKAKMKEAYIIMQEAVDREKAATKAMQQKKQKAYLQLIENELVYDNTIPDLIGGYDKNNKSSWLEECERFLGEYKNEIAGIKSFNELGKNDGVATSDMFNHIREQVLDEQVLDAVELAETQLMKLNNEKKRVKSDYDKQVAYDAELLNDKDFANSKEKFNEKKNSKKSSANILVG